jgi:hypothetical protein
MGSGGEGVEGREGSGGVGGGGGGGADLLQGLTPAERCAFCCSVLSSLLEEVCVAGGGGLEGAFLFLWGRLEGIILSPPSSCLVEGPISYATKHVRSQKIIGQCVCSSPPPSCPLSRGPSFLSFVEGPISYTTIHIRRQRIISRTLAAREAQKRKASQV